MRKEDNREKYKEYDHRYYIKHRRPNSKIGKLETKISDLEAKLAESEHRNEQLVDALNGEVFINYKLPMENAQLKQQLGEKDEKIAYLTKQVKKFNNEAQKYFEDAYCNDFHNQDKISFAVDVLEEIADCSNYINSKLDFECGSYVSEKAIRNKIKYLKGKKDE